MKRTQQISSSVDSLDPNQFYMALNSLRTLFTELHPSTIAVSVPVFHLVKNPVKRANTSFVTSYSTNPNPVHSTRWTRDDFPPKRPGLMGKFWLQKDIFMITAILGQTQTSFDGTSFYVTICDYM